MLEEIEIKTVKLRQLINRKQLSGILLSSQTNFLWLTGGRRNEVIKNYDISLVYLFITKDDKYLISSSSDSARVMDEELSGLGFNLIKYDWYNQSPINIISKHYPAAKIGADFYDPNLEFLEDDLARLRIDLTKSEIDRIRKFCMDYSMFFTDFCLQLKPGFLEEEIAYDFTYRLLKKGIRVPVILVGSDERVFKYRHPVATSKKVEKYILLATVAERDGVNISVSRSVYFGKAPEDLNKRQEAVNYIEAIYCSKSKPGEKLKNILESGKEAYKGVSYENEWKNHTQGGIVAYQPREVLATESCDLQLSSNNLVSWNPTVPGAKAEDIILIKDNGAEQLSIDKRWPCSEIKIGNEKYLKPKILEL